MIDLYFGENPHRWLTRGGRPAACLDGHQGIPTYETDDGQVVLYTLLLVHADPQGFKDAGQLAYVSSNDLMLPRDYARVSVISVYGGGEGLCCLHDDPEARWDWRPLLYMMRGDHLIRLGSQMELTWRYGLAEVENHKMDLNEQLLELALSCAEEGTGHEEYVTRGLAVIQAFHDAPPALEQTAAIQRADRILREHLSPLQRLELEAHSKFHVRGTINPCYQIELANGAAIVDPHTHQAFVSLCIHPEEWMPDADVALATKLLIESGPAGEEELLAGARPRLRPAPTRGPTRAERYAWDAERALLPAPVATIT